MNNTAFLGQYFTRKLSCLILFSTLFLTGCASLESSEHAQTDKRVNASELGQYWIVKDGTLDWSVLFEEQDIPGDFTVNFKINSLGGIQDIDLTAVSDSLKTNTIKIESFTRQSFIPTKGNYSNQPVSVTARVVLN